MSEIGVKGIGDADYSITATIHTNSTLYTVLIDGQAHVSYFMVKGLSVKLVVVCKCVYEGVDTPPFRKLESTESSY